MKSILPAVGESTLCEWRSSSLDSPREDLRGDLCSNKDSQKENSRHKAVDSRESILSRWESEQVPLGGTGPWVVLGLDSIGSL